MNTQTRSAYRAILRELPRRTLSTPTPLHQRIREAFRATATPSQQEHETHHRAQEAEQLAQYARAQRTYAELVARYNPGMTLNEEEKIRLTARRVGMELPVEVEKKE